MINVKTILTWILEPEANIIFTSVNLCKRFSPLFILLAFGLILINKIMDIYSLIIVIAKRLT